MVKYIVKRLLLSIFILMGVSMIIYFIIRLMPMDYIDNTLRPLMQGSNMTEERLNEIKALYGLADNSFVGILKGYFQWLGKFITGDMGTSFLYGEKVEDVIINNMGISFAISFISLILELLIAIPLGVKCAVNQYGKLDYTATVICMTLMAFPTFFLGNLFIMLFADKLHWFDSSLGLVSSTLPVGTSGLVRFGDMVWHLVLPMIVLVLLNVGSYMRYQRTNTLEVLNADYIRTARAKGLSENKVIYKHVFRNTMIPLVTVLASALPMLFGGAMITETVFQIPGIGKKTYDALMKGDIPLAMGYNMFIAILTVLGILLSDIMYAVVDPRVKLGK